MNPRILLALSDTIGCRAVVLRYIPLTGGIRSVGLNDRSLYRTPGSKSSSIPLDIVLFRLVFLLGRGQLGPNRIRVPDIIR